MNTILLVDDEPLVLAVHEEMFRNLGYAVIVAQDAKSALSYVRKGAAVDLVITDYCMPAMNGVDFIKTLRHSLPLVPVLVLTGSGQLELDPNLGVFACFHKPVSEEKFKRTIRDALEHAETKYVLLTALQ
jgi:CheY-like chemotaxis protein